MAHAARVALIRPSLIAAHVAVTVLAIEAVLAFHLPQRQELHAPCFSIVCQQATARRLPSWRRWRDPYSE